MNPRTVGPFNSGAAAGGAGVATANADTPHRLQGVLLAVYVKYNDSPPGATCDVVVKTKGTSPAAPSLTLLTLTDAAADGWFFPRALPVSSVNAAITNAHDHFPIDDYINVAIAQANNADNVDVWLILG